jgi:glycosyltransferase involved in cell wall biosynthesis
MKNQTPVILYMSAWPPMEKSLATYSYNLSAMVARQFSESFEISGCALERNASGHAYPSEVKYTLNTNVSDNLVWFANEVNTDSRIRMVHIQHDFNSFGGEFGENLLYFLYSVFKPVVITLHDIIPFPDKRRQAIIQAIATTVSKIIVLTERSSQILQDHYNIPVEKINVIPYGIHPVIWQKKEEVKEIYSIKDRITLTTFGLLSPEKNIESVLESLQKVVSRHPAILYRVIGETHPETREQDGEYYREFLYKKVRELGLEKNVEFINRYLDRYQIIEYLKQTDIYILPSRAADQAINANLSYAMSCGCAIISSRIPEVMDTLNEETAILIDVPDYNNQMEEAISMLLNQPSIRKEYSGKSLDRSHSASWMNVSISHARLYFELLHDQKELEFTLPEISMDHVIRLTSNFGIIQASSNCLPDYNSGFTLDDNTRALIAVCMHFEITSERGDLGLLERYISFIENCQKPDGSFINYVGDNGDLLALNEGDNLEDSNGRAIWALGYLQYNHEILPAFLIKRAESCMNRSLLYLKNIKSPRAKAFVIKGLWYYTAGKDDSSIKHLITRHADDLAELYLTHSDVKRTWYEGNLAYANCVLPESMLLAYQMTGYNVYKDIAFDSFEFVLSEIFNEKHFRVNTSTEGRQLREWKEHGEEPIDVAYAIIALEKFFNFSGDDQYLAKMKLAFSWFLGNNHLGQMVYNPVTGGCFDGLRFDRIVLDQSAEATVCYLMARVIMERNNARLMSLSHAAEIDSVLNKRG